MKKIIIGNWKMNKTNADTIDFLKKIKKNQNDNSIDFGIASSFTLLDTLNKNKIKNMLIFAQNMSHLKEGALTGEVSANMLKELNVDGVIIGHSERRKNFAESNDIINKKILLAIENNLLPIVCVGETLEEKEKNITKKIIKKQILESTKGVKIWNKIIIAYEPIWAIGKGESSTPKEANDICKFIKEITSSEVRVQYGGSINEENIKDFLKEEYIDGALIGAASLSPSSFSKFINNNYKNEKK